MRKDGKIIPRPLKIDKRIIFTLDKKLVKLLGWKNLDKIIQQPYDPQTLILFNVSHNERLPKIDSYKKDYFLDLCADNMEKSQKDYKRLVKRYGKGTSGRKTRALGKIDKGRINEEDIEKYKKGFAIKSTEESIKRIEKNKVSMNKYYHEFIEMIKNNPKTAIEMIMRRKTNQNKEIDKKLSEDKKSLKKLLKNVPTINW